MLQRLIIILKFTVMMLVKLDLKVFFQSKFNSYQTKLMMLCPQITKDFLF